MNISIDISPVVYGTGVSIYTKNLVKNLLLVDCDNDYLLFGGSLRRSRELKDFIVSLNGLTLRSRVLPIPPTLADILWNRLHLLPIEVFVGSVDVFHSSDWTQPPSKAFKVTTIHDLSPILFPSDSHPKVVEAHKARLKWILKEVDRVIVPSETTAKDAINVGVDKNKIRIIPEAVDESFRPESEIKIESIKRKYGISGRYLLSVGVNLRKNTGRIIQAYDNVRKDINANLVIIGHPYMQVSASEKVTFTGHVSQSDISAIFSGAEALVYPSLYEGYGLPILEAYACGTPVVTSNFGSMVEIASETAELVDPYSITSISSGILKALKNRNKLIQRGFSYVKKYSWHKTASMTLDVYNECGRNY